MIDLALDSKIFIDSNIDAALQELDLLFNTVNTELIGYPKYGTNFEQFLWQMLPSPNALESYITDKFNDTYFLSKMETSVSVNVTSGEFRNIYEVTIYVTDSNKKIQKRVYQFR